MSNWVDGYAVLTGTIKDILAFITRGTMYYNKPVHAKIEGTNIIFPDGFIPEDLCVCHSDRAFISFDFEPTLKKLDAPDLYEVSITWDQAHGFMTEEISDLAKRHNLAIEVEGIVFELELKEHIIVNNQGEVLFAECIDYHHEDYDPYDDYTKIK